MTIRSDGILHSGQKIFKHLMQGQLAFFLDFKKEGLLVRITALF